MLKREKNNYFVSLPSLRELVCYKLKISEPTFEHFLNVIYKLNLTKKTTVSISIESDRIIEDEKRQLRYIKQEPVIVDGKQRNIIAINVARK